MAYEDDDTTLPLGLAKLLQTPVKTKYDYSPEERRERAFKKALENTTPSHAGTPWEQKQEQGIEGETEEDVKQRLVSNILGR